MGPGLTILPTMGDGEMEKSSLERHKSEKPPESVAPKAQQSSSEWADSLIEMMAVSNKEKDGEFAESYVDIYAC